MRRYLIDRKDDIRQLAVRSRHLDLPVTKRFVVSLIGPRRAGKTYALYDFILNKQRLADEDFLFLNFEELFPERAEEVRQAIGMHQEIYNREPEFIFLDEVQALQGWERTVYTLHERKRYCVFVTGSSSRLLSREIATQLRGRALTVQVLPLSFREFLDFKGVHVGAPLSTRAENRLKAWLREYLADGGFPDIAVSGVNRKLFFRDYLDIVVFRDVVERFRIRSPANIRLLMDHMLSSFAREFSIHRVYRELKSRGAGVSKKSLYAYAGALEEVMFCFFLRKFSPSLRKAALSTPKIYLNDPGLVNHAAPGGFAEKLTWLMENAVFLELKRMEGVGQIDGLWYWRDYQGREVDFVVEAGGARELIQVTYARGMDDIRKRELDPVRRAAGELRCRRCTVLTWDCEGERRLGRVALRFVPLWRWLLGPSGNGRPGE
jgi:hypothetical protein